MMQMNAVPSGGLTGTVAHIATARRQRPRPDDPINQLFAEREDGHDTAPLSRIST